MFLHLSSFLGQVLNGQNATTLFMFLSLFIISMLLLFKFTRRSKLNLPPSPPKLPIIGNLHQLGTLPHRTFQALSQMYGPLMMLQLGQLPLLVVSSTDMAREVMQTQDVAFASRPHLTATKALLYDCKDIAFGSYGETWKQKKKGETWKQKKKLCVVELLSQKRVQGFQFIREEEVGEVVYKIRKANGSIVNLSEILIATANNIICRIIFGRKYDAEGFKFGELVREIMNQILDFSVGDLFPMLGWVDILKGQIKKYKGSFGAMNDFFDNEIAAHKMARGDPKKKDFLDILLELQEGGLSEFVILTEGSVL